MTEELQKKVNRSLKILHMIPTDKPIELAYSGGKDSDVILELAKMAGIPFEAIYKNTTIDPPGTIAHCKENGVTILHPKETFFDIIKRKGPPSRRARFCCEVLKEYKVKDVAIQGIRRSESTARAARYKEPQICRFYGAKKNHVSVFLPILDWTDEDVAEFVTERKIKLAPHYYRPDGTIDFKRRLGCMGCPLATDNGVSEFKARPKFFRAYVNAVKAFWEAHPQSASRLKFGSVYELIYHNLFCRTYEEYYNIFRGGQLFENERSAKDFLEEYFNIEL